MSQPVSPRSPERPDEPAFNLLSCPGLRGALSDLTEKLAATPEYTHESFVALAKPSIYQHLTPDAQGSLFDFQGAGYAPDDNEAQPVSLENAEFLDIDHRRIAGEWRVVFALSTEPHDAPVPSLRPPYIDIDPLAAGNVLTARDSLHDIETRLLTGLKAFAELSLRLTAQAETKRSPLSTLLALHNDVATEADYLCRDLSLADYELSARSLERYFEVRDRRVYPLTEGTGTLTTTPTGIYSGIRFIQDVVAAGKKPLQPAEPRGREAPCLVIATDQKTRLYYPLDQLADITLRGYRTT